MTEKYVNYVNLSDGTDLLDLRHDSVKPEFLLLGETAHDATGKPIVGELEVGEVKEEQVKSLAVTSNGSYTVLPDEGKVLSKATVTVRVPTKKEQEVTYPTITENGSYEILPEEGKVMSKATVEVDVPERYDEGYAEGKDEGYNEGYQKGYADHEPTVKALTVTANGTYTPSNGVDGFNLVIVKVPTEGDSGGGIIDVTKLPTSGIDENAVYRLIENVQTEKTQIYIVDERNASKVMTINEYFVLLGIPTIPNIYEVDNLSNMLETDVQYWSAINLYILRSDGVAYANVPAYGGIITVGLFGFQSMGYDKGTTENVYAETEDGIYTTLEAFGEVARYFIRESDEWVELNLPSASEIMEVADTPLILTKGYFRKPNGSYVKHIRDYVFSEANVVSVELPNGLVSIGKSAFEWNNIRQIELPYSLVSIDDSAFQGNGITQIVFPENLESVAGFSSNIYLSTATFKGIPRYIDDMTFYFCNHLTTINVPWSEGEVTGAPWGAPNATINYNYTGE